MYKIISLILSLILIFSIPTTVFADSELNGEGGVQTTIPSTGNVNGEGTTPPVSGSEGEGTNPPASGDEGGQTPETPPTEIQTNTYTFVYISEERVTVEAVSTESALQKINNSEDKITAFPDENKHYIEKYKWELSAENEFLFNEVVDEEKSETVDCSEFQDYNLEATCIAEGLKDAKECVACGNISGGQIVERTAHNFVYEITQNPNCAEDGKLLAKCTTDGCVAEFEYVVASTHHYLEWETVEEPKCNAPGKEISYCEICKAPAEHEIAPVETNHEWTNNSLSCANDCGAVDTVTEILSVECDNIEYFVGDEWNSTLTLTVKCGEREVTFTTTDNLLKDFTTAEEGEKTFAVCIDNVVSEQVVTINVKEPEFNVKVGNKTLYDGGVAYLNRDGVNFVVNSTSGDDIYYKVSNSNLIVDKNEEDGTFTVKPKKYLDITSIKDYYVTFCFKRNDIEYCQKIYFRENVESVKCITKSKTITNGSKSTVTLKFIETYKDGTTQEYTEKKVTLKGSSVGKKTYKSDYYGSSAPYVFYVKCKTPTLKAKAGTKSVTLTWNKISGATGYKIYRSTSKNGTYKDIKTISGNSTVSYKNKKLSSKKTYYYKIVAVYSKTSKCNSSYSSVASCKTK